jgi:epsilon-lactone hydrolase
MEIATVRDQLRSVLIEEIAPRFRGTSLQEQRATLDAMGAQAEMPAGLAVERGFAAGVPVEWLTPTNATERTVLYLHGGGFSMGSCASHRNIAARVAVACCARSVVPEYRLAPEHPFPQGLDDILAVFESLLASGIPADQMIFAADSGAAGLAISTVLRGRERGLPAPGAMVLLSPWVDLTLSGDSHISRATVDPWLSQEILVAMRDAYIGETDPTDPLISPLLADLSGLPPMLVQVGDQEILLSDSSRLAARAIEAGVRVELEVWEAMWHVWHLFSPTLPEANRAFEQMGAFIDAQFARTGDLRICG